MVFADGKPILLGEMLMRFHSGVLKQYRDPDFSTKNSVEIECTQKNARINTAYQATNFRYTDLLEREFERVQYRYYTVLVSGRVRVE
jgi:hypothetical protein